MANGESDAERVNMMSGTSIQNGRDGGLSVEASERVIGKASATERIPNSSEKFSFWLAPDEVINPFDIVDVEAMKSTRTFGLVTNVSHITDAPSHLSNFISNDFGTVNGEPQTPRQGVNVAEVSVLANGGEPADNQVSGVYMPIQNEASVRFANEKGIHIALGIDGLAVDKDGKPNPDAIPAGIIRMSNETKAKLLLDRRFVLGPEGAHVNISGISGLATKTSYAMFLIQSIIQSSPDRDIAVILLNVKQDDLLTIDQPNDKLTDSIRRRWTDLGLEARPFRDV